MINFGHETEEPEFNKRIRKIIAKAGFGERAEITVFRREEDGSDYSVWKIAEDGVTRVLKKTSKREKDIYDAFLVSAECGAPGLYKSIEYDGELFLLTEYIEGHNLQKCDRKSLTAAMDALIYLQNMYWEKRQLQGIGHGFEASLPGRQKRGKYLNDTELKQAYERFLRIYQEIPQTLCHDDLLPFNVICTKKRAVLIDWEYAGILPYPTSLARLIAHGEEDESAFFFMTQKDKDYAIDYYYEHLLKEKGIDYNAYRKTLDYFLLYEYCEWIMLGIEYNDTGSERFQKYYSKAKEHIKKLK